MSQSPAKSASNIVWHDGHVTRAQRQSLLGQSGATVWFTGLSGSGKSTIACALEQVLLERRLITYRLDGDNIRHGLNANLGFTAEDRAENIRRIGEVAKLMTDACMFTLVSFVSPYRADRDRVRKLHDEAGLPFVEVHVDVPLSVAQQRDPKGLYAKAIAGQIAHFTGISDPYEPPVNAELVLDTSRVSVEESVRRVVDLLTARALLPTAGK
jgi:adenylylsulfate kinase